MCKIISIAVFSRGMLFYSSATILPIFSVFSISIAWKTSTSEIAGISDLIDVVILRPLDEI